MKKIILITVFMLLAFSVFGKSLVGHWDVEDSNLVVSFYADQTYVTTLNETGEIIDSGRWDLIWGILEMGENEPLIVEWIDGDTVRVGVEGTDNTVIIKRQEGV